MNSSNRPPGPRQGGRRGNHGAPQLFDDTSTQQPAFTPGGYGGPQGTPQGYGMPQPGYGGQPDMTQGGFPGQAMMSDPMANMAMSYGSSLAGQGSEMVAKNLEKYMATSKLKYYFAVDTGYVGKKLGLVLFPFAHKDWSVKYNDQEPVAPRFDINAPDLYIPVMAFVTYLLTAGILLGTQNKFTPEQLGVQASSALVWLIIEVLVILATSYITNTAQSLRYLDLLAFCGYKYVGMILALVASLAAGSTAYYCALVYSAAALAFFLIRSLRVKVLSEEAGGGYGGRGSKRRLYLLLSIALLQPIFMWWLTAWVATV